MFRQLYFQGSRTSIIHNNAPIYLTSMAYVYCAHNFICIDMALNLPLCLTKNRRRGTLHCLKFDWERVYTYNVARNVPLSPPCPGICRALGHPNLRTRGYTNLAAFLSPTRGYHSPLAVERRGEDKLAGTGTFAAFLRSPGYQLASA